jgi:hypothetical protein
MVTRTMRLTILGEEQGQAGRDPDSQRRGIVCEAALQHGGTKEPRWRRQRRRRLPPRRT